MKRPVLHVLLGEGGVGKTTLAAGYALSLARDGAHVGLLGIDPALRLQSALGVGRLTEAGLEVPSGGKLTAALLRPEDSLRRWAAEQCRDPEVRGRLEANPFFLALADRLAGTVDALAAIRAAEWAEKDPQLDHLVVDTAPGLHGLDFLAQPDQLLLFLQGRLVRWLRAVAPAGHRGAAGRIGERILHGLSGLSGEGTLSSLIELFALSGDVVATMAGRLEKARAWLKQPATERILVCAPRGAGAEGARRMRGAMNRLGQPPAVVVLNRSLPTTLTPASLRPPPDSPIEAHAFLQFVRGCAGLQADVLRELESLGCPVVVLPTAAGLDGPPSERLEALAGLGQQLRAGLPRHAACFVA